MNALKEGNYILQLQICENPRFFFFLKDNEIYETIFCEIHEAEYKVLIYIVGSKHMTDKSTHIYQTYYIINQFSLFLSYRFSIEFVLYERGRGGGAQLDKFERGRRYFCNRKIEIIHGLSPSVKCVAPLLALVQNAGEGGLVLLKI